MKKVTTEQKGINKGLAIFALVALCAFCFFSGTLCSEIALERQMEGSSGAELRKLEEIYSVMKDKWYFASDMENPSETLAENAIIGMTTSQEDPHTNYFSLEEARAFSQALSGSNTGIGVTFYLNGDKNMAVKSVFLNSAAAAAGIEPGDIITQVGDLVVKDHTSDELVQYIQSHDGQELVVEGLRDNQPITFTLTPGNYNSSVSVKPEDGYGIVEVTTFGEQTGTNFSDALKTLKDAGINNLVLDLRGNTGGLVSAAQDVAASLVGPDETLMQEKLADGTINTYKTSKNFAKMDFDHIYVLQDGNTASASEVVIGALKDNLGEKVTTVGTTSYGKGTEQRSIPFSDGTSLKYTIAEWLTPNGTSINGTGFTPDEAVSDTGLGGVRYVAMEESEVIKPDTVSGNAKAAQQLLKMLGYNADREDEYFSAASSEALKQFQQEHGLETTGEINSATLDALLDAAALKLNEGGLEDDEWIQKTVSLMQE